MKPVIENQWIGIDLYKKGKSTTQISRETNTPLSTVRSRLLKAGALRSRVDAIRLAASQGRFTHNKGERRQISESHRESISLSNKKRDRSGCAGISVKPNGYVEITQGENKGRGQHVVVIEKQIGRKILPSEVVHHIDHNRKNNSPENLILMTRSEHSKLHAQENNAKKERNSNGRFC